MYLKNKKGQLSLDLLLAVVVFGILFSSFYFLSSNVTSNMFSLENKIILEQKANNLRPYFSFTGLPESYNFNYLVNCNTKYSFFKNENSVYIKDTDTNTSKIIYSGNVFLPNICGGNN